MPGLATGVGILLLPLLIAAVPVVLLPRIVPAVLLLAPRRWSLVAIAGAVLAPRYPLVRPLQRRRRRPHDVR